MGQMIMYLSIFIGVMVVLTATRTNKAEDDYEAAKPKFAVFDYDKSSESKALTAYLKKTFSSGRSKAGNGETSPFIPPVALNIDSPHGPHLLAVGRRKWRSQGGYPTLTHGGLSLLEVLSPFIELTK